MRGNSANISSYFMTSNLLINSMIGNVVICSCNAWSYVWLYLLT